MKKRSILVAICALISAFTVGAASGCDALSGMLGGSSVQENSENSEIISETSEKPEDPSTSETPETPEDPSTSETPETPEDPSTSETPETPEDPGTSETPEDPEKPSTSQVELTVVSPAFGEEVFPYVDAAKAFLQAGAGADVADYYQKMDNAYKPIELKWQLNGKGTRKIVVEYATKADYSDAISVEVGATQRSIEVYNLYKDTNYYLRVTAFGANSTVLGQTESEFVTTDLGPRVMNIEGICNVRDIGGYETSLGKTIQQGIAFRGGALKDKNSKLQNGDWLALTESGKTYMSEVMGIKGELDFRDENESGIKLSDGSLIPGATLTYITAGGYQDIFHLNGGAKPYRKIFSYFANEDNYPLYMHCTAGADRTGSVVYILQALLGVSELECAQGYEFTSFSIYGLRGESDPHNGTRYKEMKELLQAYPGENLQQKAENYLLSIGVTETEIYNIKAIFFGEETIEMPKEEPETPTPDTPNVPTGVEVTMDGLFNFDATGAVTFTNPSTLHFSNGVVGYGNTAIIHMSMEKVEPPEGGGLRVFLGSYGFELRGGIMRVYTVDKNGNIAEVSRNTGLKVDSFPFVGGGTLTMKVEIVENTAVMTVRIEGSVTGEFSWTFDRISGEIAHENAKMSFYMRQLDVASLTIYNETAWANK